MDEPYFATLREIMPDKPRLLLVDDESAITSTLTTFLELSGFIVETAANGEQALEKIQRAQPDLIILDVLMPHLNGRETLRKLRADGNWTPVILLTQVTGKAEQIMALEEGADDYLGKPFDPQELVVRIRAILRRTQSTARQVFSARRIAAGDLALDRSARRVIVSDEEVPLTPQAVATLEYLLTHRDELITRERLLDAVWGWESDVGLRVVDTRIAELRKALKDSPLEPRYIETIPGQGYRFIAAVTEASK
jgi:DNA-binding response OmpR family regulator